MLVSKLEMEREKYGKKQSKPQDTLPVDRAVKGKSKRREEGSMFQP